MQASIRPPPSLTPSFNVQKNDKLYLQLIGIFKSDTSRR